MKETEQIQTLLFHFGIISDLQYADREDGWNYTKTSRRHYRGTLDGLQRALNSWSQLLSSSAITTDRAASAKAASFSTNDLPAAKAEKPEKATQFFILQLGDLIDGYAKDGRGGSETALRKVLAMFEDTLPHCEVHHCMGNHELYNLPKNRWATLFPCYQDPLYGGKISSPSHEQGYPPSTSPFYYAFSPYPGWLFVNLDTYDISVLGSSPSSIDVAKRHVAEGFLKINSNQNKNSPVGLKGLNQRFLAYNGGVGGEQLRWLQETLSEAQQRHQKVIVFGHIPLYPGATHEDCLLWNYEEVLEKLHAYPSFVLVYLAGHCHRAGVAQDDEGIWHYSLDTPLERRKGVDAYSMAFVYQDRIEIKGAGVNPDLSIPLPPA